MNKFVLLLALVAAFVGLASAGKKLGGLGGGIRPRQIEEVEEEELEFGGGSEFGGEIGHRPPLGHGPVVFPHGQHGGFRGEFGGEGGEFIGHQGGFEGHHGINRHPHHFQGGMIPHHRRGFNRFGGSSFGAGGFREEDEFGLQNRHRTRAGLHRAGEGHKGFIEGKKKGFEAGVKRQDLNEREGHNKHQGFNKDKLIVKEHETGINDDVGFRNRNEHSEGAQIGAAESKILGAKSGGKFEEDGELEHESRAGLRGRQEQEAGVVGGSSFGAGGIL